VNGFIEVIDARVSVSGALLFLFFGSLCVASAAYPTYAQTPAIRPAPAFSAEELNAPPTSNWPTHGGSLSNQRYSPLTQITRENLENLKGVWRTHLDGSGSGPRYSGEAHPIVYDGVIYIPTGANDVFALSVENGEILWKYQANLDDAIDTVCCGWTSRGVGFGAGKVFSGQLDGKLVALDQTNGNVVWSVQAERWQDGYTITSAPLYYNGLVITGFAGAERATRGRVKAYDANDGSLVWTFYTIPAPGEFGNETWPQDNEAWRYGGGAVWQTPAVDPELGLIYFSTANANPDLDGSHRAGDNLFTSSVLALDAMSGEYRWHYQTVHHDLWDYDMSTPVVLFDLDMDGPDLQGPLRRGLGAASKTGWVYILDRETGVPIVGIEELPVPQEPRQATAATQPHPIGDGFVPQSIDIAPEGFKVVNGGRIFTPFWTEPGLYRPGSSGGANWPPNSYDPVSQILYVCASDRYQATAYTEPVNNEMPLQGERRVGGPLRGQLNFPRFGIFAALDMTTNRLVWQQRWIRPCYSGSAVTATGLVFVGRSDGRLMALDAADGSHLWEFQTGAGVNAPPAIFEHDGDQYIVVYSAGNLFAGSPRGDSVWLFSLRGTLDPVMARPIAAVQTARQEVEVAENVVVTEPDLDAGRLVFAQTCAFCHGSDGTGGHEGPSLAKADERSFVSVIVRGGRSDMPGFEAVLTAQEIADVAAYVVQELGE
jgi:quinohemoprotein ethanol dehydrogenase